MHNHENTNGNIKTRQNSFGTPAASSFVYPVRSLLTGIQPASNSQKTIRKKSPPDSSSSPTSSGEIKSVGSKDDSSSSIASARSTSAAGDSGSPHLDDRTDRSPQRTTGSPGPNRGRKTATKHVSSPECILSQADSNASKPPTAKPIEQLSQSFQRFSIDENPYFPKTAQSHAGPANSTTAQNIYTAGPMGEAVLLSSSPLDNDTRHENRSQLSRPAEAFKVIIPTDASTTAPPENKPPPASDLPFNPSEYGLVHLPPLPVSPPGGGSSGGQSRSRSVTSSVGRPSRSSQNSAEPTTQSLSSLAQRLEPLREVTPPSSGSGSERDFLQSPSPSRPQAPNSSEAQFHGSTTEGGNAAAARPPSQSDSNRSGTGSNSDSELSSDFEPLVTFRYEHARDEDGHHLVVGREGKLTRCEDEPIRTPGAVQGFGVLIAVDEDIENGTLVVHQVSENSGELLGLSPKYLFSLECFTDTLTDSQADILWDNIQFLNEPEVDVEEQEDSPHIFLVTGFGEPGSAQPDDMEADRGRISWTCWCAVHRPQSSNPNGPGSSTVGGPGLIIMEFELERDGHYPLYPPIVIDASAGTASPASSSSLSTDGSDSTLVATESDAGSAINVPTPTAGDVPTALGRSGAQPWSPSTPMSLVGLEGEDQWVPSAEDILESTTSRSKPLLALERLRHMTRAASAPGSQAVGGGRPRRNRRGVGASGGIGMMDVFAVMAQINEQLGAAPDLETFLKVVVGVIKDLTQFHRVLVYQFDEAWNGQVVAELVDWSQTHDLYKGLHFPASDIPAQARELYSINKVRLLYDRSQTTARIVVRNRDDLETPLNMTHCYLRAMSPIHVQYLANMGVRASMSISIMAFGALWGLVTCHSYGSHGMRVSFPVRQMLRLLSQSISRNIERLSYAQRLHTRKLINTMGSDDRPTGYIVSNADDLLGLFDADYGILVIGEGAKILGPNQHGQEILVMAEYLRLKQFNTIQVSQAVVKDFPDLRLSTGLEVIAGLLYVPLSSGGKDFIALLRKGQPRDVHWAGKPYRDGPEPQGRLEPRKSFKTWTETVAGRCRAWTDEQLETAGVLALVYGKFIEVWRQKENALYATKLTELLLSNASHEVRTPLNHIINYLEMALHGPLDLETRDNLSRSHAASKSLLFTINDLLDLTRLESGNETSFNEPFELRSEIEDAVRLYRNEARRRNIDFKLEVAETPKTVIGDSKKIRTVVSNLTANALKYTSQGQITVQCHTFGEPEGLRGPKQTAVEIVVADTGCGISSEKLESIFREFEQVESSGPKTGNATSVGLGLAVVARIVEQLGGQLRVDSTVNEGSRFSFLIPLALRLEGGSEFSLSPASSRGSSQRQSRAVSLNSRRSGSEIDSLVEALGSNHMIEQPKQIEGPSRIIRSSPRQTPGTFEVTGSSRPIRPVKIDGFQVDGSVKPRSVQITARSTSPRSAIASASSVVTSDGKTPDRTRLRVLIVEDNDINRIILAKRLTRDGHTVVNTTNGQEGLDIVVSDMEFDCILMDIQMPILNGFEATERIRALEYKPPSPSTTSSSTSISTAPPPLQRRLSHILNGRMPIFAVSASLFEAQRDDLSNHGIDGWILKPIDFKRLDDILKGVTDLSQRERDVYRPGCNWEIGGWLGQPSSSQPIVDEPSKGES